MPRSTTSWKRVETFRRGSSALFKSPSFKGYGANLQNTKRELLHIYIADAGKIFFQRDQSGAEALIVAYLCRAGNFRELFEYGIKPHVFMALHIFKDEWIREGYKDCGYYATLKPSELASAPGWNQMYKIIKNHDVRYFVGKKSIHAFNYGMNIGTFQVDVLTESEGSLYLPKALCEKILNTHRDLFPEIHQGYHVDIREQLTRNKVLYNLFGFPRQFTGNVTTDDCYRKALAFIPQSTVGIITERAFAGLQNYIESNNKDWDVLNDKHDSVLGQCDVDEGPEALRILRDLIEVDLVSPRGEKFRMRSEGSLGMNWAKYNKETNPNGMKEFTE